MTLKQRNLLFQSQSLNKIIIVTHFNKNKIVVRKTATKRKAEVERRQVRQFKLDVNRPWVNIVLS